MSGSRRGLRGDTARMWVLVGVFVAGLIGAGIFINQVVDDSRIGSARYTQIVAIKNLQSQLDASDLRLTNAQLKVQEFLVTKPEPAAATSAFTRLETNYEQRFATWESRLAELSATGLQGAVESSREATAAYFAVLEGPFVKALGADEPEAVQTIVDGDLARALALQEASLQVLDGLAAEQLAAAESAAVTDLRADKRLLAAGGLAAGVVAILLGLVTLRLMSSRLRRMRQLTEREFPLLLAQSDRAGDGQSEPVALALPAVRGRDHLARTERAVQRVVVTAVDQAEELARLRTLTADLFAHTGRRNHQLLSLALARLASLESVGLDSTRAQELDQIRTALTRMRRDASGMLVMAGEAPVRQWETAVPPMQALQAALAEIEAADRVDWDLDESVEIAGQVGADVAHVLAELLDNATCFSNADTRVTVTGVRSEDGYVFTITDAGLGIPAAELAAYNTQLADSAHALHDSRRLGLAIVARLADRHDLDVTLSQLPTGGLVATVVLPPACLSQAEPEELPGRVPALSLAVSAVDDEVVLPVDIQERQLPRRVRGASLDPTLRQAQPNEQPDYRSPEAVRQSLNSLAVGRIAAADRHPGQVDPNS